MLGWTLDGLDRSYEAFDRFKPSKHYVVALGLEEEGGNGDGLHLVFRPGS
jgi:hypothetical protein